MYILRTIFFIRKPAATITKSYAERQMEQSHGIQSIAQNILINLAFENINKLILIWTIYGQDIC